MIAIYDWSKTPLKDKQKIIRRSQIDMDQIKTFVARRINEIRKGQDKAVLRYIRKFDCANFKLKNLRVSAKEIDQAYRKIHKNVLKMIRAQISISRKFHESQAKLIIKKWSIATIKGVRCGFKKVPLESVGLYVPAGKAPLPTVAQILTVAAKAAEVSRIVVCFPPTDAHYEIIVAAIEAGATEIYRVGGIAAIAALTYGTETIQKVSKIAGPGSPYVQAAKRLVFGDTGIEMISGPSEALIIADESANPSYLAADILARCEHGPDSAGVLATNSKTLALKTKQEIEIQFKKLSRKEYIKEALQRYSALIVLDTEDQVISFANEYAPEHLEIQTKHPEQTYQKIRNAGSVFLGSYAPVAVGDYATGTNHCLPTGEAVKYSSPVSVETFLKTIQFQILTKAGLRKLQPIVRTISGVEGLDAHAASVNIRFSK